MSDELKPCPTCGATLGLYVLYDEHDMEWFVFCDNCKTSICNENNVTRDDAIETWNRCADECDRYELNKRIIKLSEEIEWYTTDDSIDWHDRIRKALGVER